jgi:protein-disulfide isomerase
MLKQLYKRNTTALFTAALLGIMSFSLSGCSDDVTEEKMAVVEEKTSEASVVEQTTTETIIEAAAQGESDAGFLDYDMVIGDPNAPVELIEYASLTCNHCATFHTQVLPLVKEKYVDTGKVKIVFRSFLLNGVDAQATVLTRCVSESRYFTFMNALFTRQTSWYDVGEYQRLAGEHDQQTAGQMFVAHVMGEVEKLARQVGLNKNKIDACFSNQAIGEYIFAVQQDGIAKYNINATPTIVVDGKVVGNTYAAVEQAVEAALN